MDIFLEYLIRFLEDEFSGYSDVQIRLLAPTTTRRSVDLIQDYDPETADLHRQQGVLVKTKNREYYFPYEWAALKRYGEIQTLARKIKDSL